MKKTLFILSKQQDETANEIIAEAEAGTIVLVQDAVYRNEDWPLPVYVEKEEAEARGIDSPHSLVEEDEILDMIETHECVVVL
ncbi:hypothetical protein AM501_23425 [Aneurinibacillus migulanus]|uniref:Sulfur relay protein TusB/DsrH n=1 Tax=Aneurinibacillus migulanus TaxID=47500 RepID=A0A0D1WNA9_ANEMI|nr:hypothetical protein [Aneurinibacillus migulanus]KIV56779.1 hypothetical protein TS64_08345 [Aneurinibacillus migulanus]KIV60145.1 hypothetical protein TS65_01705 [Aneurinibacillus migulanus]KON96736.1 hypothetical protein AF333_15880 [Aneurinibacillus migulanus]KPD05932.1 hypothetical protein AM501_23425 [Aneurinibacillus migulanus]MED0893491.1 hypothetical protein [Aneurinibacillus migulanus]